MQSNLTCTWFEVAANKNHTFFSGRARDTGKWKNKAIFDPQEYERNALPNLLRWLTTSSRVKRKSLSKCLDKLEQEMCWNNVIWSLPVNEHSSIHCPVYVVMLLNANSFFFCCFFIFLLFEFSSYMGFKFRVLINFARIYFRGSLISHFFFNREKRQIMYTNKKYNKADLCFCLSMPSTHIPREIRILTKLFQCHSKGPLLHSER